MKFYFSKPQIIVCGKKIMTMEIIWLNGIFCRCGFRKCCWSAADPQKQNTSWCNGALVEHFIWQYFFSNLNCCNYLLLKLSYFQKTKLQLQYEEKVDLYNNFESQILDTKNFLTIKWTICGNLALPKKNKNCNLVIIKRNRCLIHYLNHVLP